MRLSDGDADHGRRRTSATGTPCARSTAMPTWKAPTVQLRDHHGDGNGSRAHRAHRRDGDGGRQLTPAPPSVTITWTNGMNADGHEVGLVNLSRLGSEAVRRSLASLTDGNVARRSPTWRAGTLHGRSRRCPRWPDRQLRRHRRWTSFVTVTVNLVLDRVRGVSHTAQPSRTPLRLRHDPYDNLTRRFSQMS